MVQQKSQKVTEIVILLLSGQNRTVRPVPRIFPYRNPFNEILRNYFSQKHGRAWRSHSSTCQKLDDHCQLSINSFIRFVMMPGNRALLRSIYAFDVSCCVTIVLVAHCVSNESIQDIRWKSISHQLTHKHTTICTIHNGAGKCNILHSNRAACSCYSRIYTHQWNAIKYDTYRRKVYIFLM